MSAWKQKRFWQQADAVPVDGGFAVHLDGRAIKTPAKAALVLPTKPMAEAIAAEWDAQDGVVDPLSMPVTRSANAAIDKVGPQHREVADLLVAYGDSDLLCYRAEAPQELVDRQQAAWDPALDWAAATLGARLSPRVGVIHAAQPPEALAALSARVHEKTAFQLAAFHDLVSLSGSLVLGFAAALGWRDADDLWDRSRVDERWQQEKWGKDEDEEALVHVRKAAFLHAKQFHDMC
ncbi:ATP12 family chaperone protein [Pontibaca salina]|uniref:ATPase n=1 Tax=Pontibaca salina TaxID=2795731 RepID=A0A934HLI4_9RHOB|nr:ATP12 family protein [Pontibaca salina]MBI6630303.1 ATPase [Pontibaca salina]